LTSLHKKKLKKPNYTLANKIKSITFAPQNFKEMAITVIKRKARRNFSRAKLRTINITNLQKIVYIKSPYKGESGIILEDK